MYLHGLRHAQPLLLFLRDDHDDNDSPLQWPSTQRAVSRSPTTPTYPHVRIQLENKLWLMRSLTFPTDSVEIQEMLINLSSLNRQQPLLQTMGNSKGAQRKRSCHSRGPRRAISPTNAGNRTLISCNTSSVSCDLLHHLLNFDLV